MGSVGELFIQLGVLGNANELKKANAEFQKANILAKKQAALEKLRAEYLERIQKTQDKAEKRELARQYRAKKNLIEQKAALDIKNAEQKILRANIAQWATYAHAVSMAASVATNAIKQIYNAGDKLLSKGQNWANINASTSLGLGTLQKYAKVGNILNAGADEMGTAQALSDINTKFMYAKLNPGKAIGSLINQELAQQLGLDSASVVQKLYSGEIATAEQYFEHIRSLIAGQAPEMQNLIAQAYGVPENLLPMLRLSTDEFERLSKAANEFALNEDQVEKLSRFKAGIGVIQKRLTDMFDQIVYEYMPYFDTFFQSIDKLAVDLLPDVKKIIEETKDAFNGIKYEDFKNAMELVLITIKGICKATAYAIKGWVELLNLIQKKRNYDEQNKKTDELIEQQRKELARIKGDKGAYIAAEVDTKRKGENFWQRMINMSNPMSYKYVEEMRREQAAKNWDKEVRSETNNVNQQNTFNIYDKDDSDRAISTANKLLEAFGE